MTTFVGDPGELKLAKPFCTLDLTYFNACMFLNIGTTGRLQYFASCLPYIVTFSGSISEPRMTVCVGMCAFRRGCLSFPSKQRPLGLGH